MIYSLIKRFTGRAWLIAVLMAMVALAALPAAAADADAPGADVSLDETLCGGTTVAALGLAVAAPELDDNLFEAQQCTPPPFPDKGCVCNPCLGKGWCTCCRMVDGMRKCRAKPCDRCP